MVLLAVNNTLWLFWIVPWEWMTAESDEGTQSFLLWFSTHIFFHNTAERSCIDTVKEEPN